MQKDQPSQHHKSNMLNILRVLPPLLPPSHIQTHTHTHTHIHTSSTMVTARLVRLSVVVIVGFRWAECLKRHMWQRWHEHALTCLHTSIHELILNLLKFYLLFLQFSKQKQKKKMHLNSTALNCVTLVELKPSTNHCSAPLCCFIHNSLCIPSLKVRWLPMTIIYVQHLCDYGN